jgi:hypothetical protein
MITRIVTGSSFVGAVLVFRNLAPIRSGDAVLPSKDQPVTVGGRGTFRIELVVPTTGTARYSVTLAAAPGDRPERQVFEVGAGEPVTLAALLS